MSCAFVDCQDKCLTFANNLGSKKDEVCGEGAGMDIDGGDEPAKEDGVNYIAATTCMYKNDECSAMDSYVSFLTSTVCVCVRACVCVLIPPPLPQRGTAGDGAVLVPIPSTCVNL